MKVSSLIPLSEKDNLKSSLSMTSLTPSYKPSGEQSFRNLPPLPSFSKNSKNLKKTNDEEVEEILMKEGNKIAKFDVKNPELEFEERNKAIPISSSLSKVVPSPTTATFETFEGIPQNQDIEKTLLAKGFIPTDKILTRDDDGNIICNFIKVRDKLGHAAFVELDCDYRDGMGFLTILPEEEIMSEKHGVSVIPYSLKIGTFEANNNDLYGVGFECDNSICVMSRKDPSLKPMETTFIHSKNIDNDMGILSRHPIPFPIVKMTDILANSEMIQKNIKTGHSRMRNVAFTSCMKEVVSLKKYSKELNEEIQRFDKISSEVSNVLASTINDLEDMHDVYEKTGAKNQKDIDNVRSIRFNLNKRHDLVNDHIANCHSMRERSEKVRVLAEELKALNDFSETLFTGLSNVFTE